MTAPKISYSLRPDALTSVLHVDGLSIEPHIGPFVFRPSSFDITLRPYQVYAVQRMVKCIDDDDGNGFVWHTTGSGKTLTSFKASTLLEMNGSFHHRAQAA